MPKKKKRGKRGKGSAFEREVAKLIVKAFAPFGIKQRECWRSVMSGGHSMSCGDLDLSDRLEKMFPYAVECKFWKQIDWIHFLVRPDKRKAAWKETQWVQQAVSSVKDRPELIPLLVMKENRGKIWAFYPVQMTSVKDYNWGVYGWKFTQFANLLKMRVRMAQDAR